MQIVAIETIKYKKSLRIPGTDSAVFDCKKEIAEELIKAKKAVLPKTLEQAKRQTGQQAADEIVVEAREEAEKIVKEAKANAMSEAEKIIKDAEEKAAKMVEDAEEKVAEVVDKAQATLNDKGNQDKK